MLKEINRGSMKGWKIAGLDADSKKLAIVMFSNDELENWFFFKTKATEPAEKLLDLSKAFDIFLKSLKPDIIFIEESFYSQNFKTSKAITEVIGNCKLACAKNKITYEMVPVRSWKKHVLKDGSASKDDVKAYVCKNYPKLSEEPQDIMDACLIACFGLEMDEKEKE